MQTDLHPLHNVIAQANPSEQDSSSGDGIPIYTSGKQRLIFRVFYALIGNIQSSRWGKRSSVLHLENLLSHYVDSTRIAIVVVTGWR